MHKLQQPSFVRKWSLLATKHYLIKHIYQANKYAGSIGQTTPANSRMEDINSVRTPCISHTCHRHWLFSTVRCFMFMRNTKYFITKYWVPPPHQPPSSSWPSLYSTHVHIKLLLPCMCIRCAFKDSHKTPTQRQAHALTYQHTRAQIYILKALIVMWGASYNTRTLVFLCTQTCCFGKFVYAKG